MDMTTMDIPYEVTEMLEEFGPMIIGIVLIVLLVVLAVSAVFYIFQSLGLYTIAKRRGIENPWLAWIPVANYWILGCISDQYRYVVKGQVKNKRKIMLGLSVGTIAVSAVVETISGVILMSGDGAEAAMALNSLMSLVSSGVSIASMVFWHMALYDLYTSCCPSNNAVFLVLGIIFSFTQPFFIFFNRKKDDGMPPRKPEYQSDVPAPVVDMIYEEPRESATAPAADMIYEEPGKSSENE